MDVTAVSCCASRAACFAPRRQAPRRRRHVAAPVRCAAPGEHEPAAPEAAAIASSRSSGSGSGALRRQVLARGALGAAALAAGGGGLWVQPAAALGFKKDLTNKRRQKIPESEYKEGPEGLK